ncbi:MAG: nucleoside monophosphate kinase [Candidatus Pacebacteria bacterium]|jgi:adenylate kinase|nr:nucleoside monophosphate kinase [Candidatus Paceibacterota bacterium]
MEFPIFKTKEEGKDKKFNLTDPKERSDYFYYKAGEEVEKLKTFVKDNTCIVYLLGKKNSGKGTYSKMLAELLGDDKLEHFSVGDMIRAVSRDIKDPAKKIELEMYLERNYRGWIPVEKLIPVIEGRDTSTLLPTELILALVKREIAKRPRKTIFIDGFPRDMDQVSYSLFFRDLIGFRDDPDVMAFIDVPTNVIAGRIAGRRICPVCNTSRNLNLLPTLNVGYDDVLKEYYLICDNPSCTGYNRQRMVPKEGDELGIEPIRKRLEIDQALMEKAMELYGIPKIYMRNAIPVDVAKNYVDDYELTMAYDYTYDSSSRKVDVHEKPWTVNDDKGVPSVSLQAPAVAVSLIKQLTKALGL